MNRRFVKVTWKSGIPFFTLVTTRVFLINSDMVIKVDVISVVSVVLPIGELSHAFTVRDFQLSTLKVSIRVLDSNISFVAQHTTSRNSRETVTSGHHVCLTQNRVVSFRLGNTVCSISKIENKLWTTGKFQIVVCGFDKRIIATI